jgi:hypothetical protein
LSGKVAKFFAVCICLTVSGVHVPTLGQGAASGQLAEKQTKEADTRRLLSLMGAGKVGAQLMDQMFSTVRSTMEQQVPPKVWKDLVAEFKAEFSPEKLIELNVPIYARHYTHDEIRQLISFYESPLGQKVTNVTPLIVKEAYEVGATHGRQLLLRIYERLRSKGYKVPVA